MNRIVLLLGGNLGEKYAILNEAEEILLERLGSVELYSSFYETEAWGFETENIFLNKVLVIRTHYTSEQSLRICQKIELELGRVRKENRYSSRLIDIDLLFFNKDIVNTEDLILPHPRIQERRFVLEPLKEVMGDFVHPIYLKKISTLLEECADECIVKKIL
ncbi:MAG: 2-amino-4-hydroxy-6-hydroxymethyldihydropteridine diphosphokinase [Marinifilaceae bacterium]